jgi:hypothetical protein
MVATGGSAESFSEVQKDWSTIRDEIRSAGKNEKSKAQSKSQSSNHLSKISDGLGSRCSRALDAFFMQQSVLQCPVETTKYEVDTAFGGSDLHV